MSGTPLPVAPTPVRDPSSWDDEPRRWLLGGLAAMFVLIGLAAVISVIAPRVGPGPFMMNGSWAPWDWIPGLVGLAIGVLIFVWVIRMAFWGIARAAGPYYGPWGYHRYYRHAAWLGVDPALEAARERYARGEISSDQYDRIVRDLTRPASGP